MSSTDVWPEMVQPKNPVAVFEVSEGWVKGAGYRSGSDQPKISQINSLQVLVQVLVVQWTLNSGLCSHSSQATLHDRTRTENWNS